MKPIWEENAEVPQCSSVNQNKANVHLSYYASMQIICGYNTLLQIHLFNMTVNAAFLFNMVHEKVFTLLKIIPVEHVLCI